MRWTFVLILLGVGAQVNGQTNSVSGGQKIQSIYDYQFMGLALHKNKF